MTFAARVLGYLASGANNGTLLAQSYTTDSILYYIGYASFIPSSTRTPTTFADGRTLAYMYDTYDTNTGEYTAYFGVSGFTSDPGRLGYFTSMAIGGNTLTAAGSSSTLYGYSSGTAGWAWPLTAWGFIGGGTSSWSKT
jgi:hypothetical protein